METDQLSAACEPGQVLVQKKNLRGTVGKAGIRAGGSVVSLFVSWFFDQSVFIEDANTCEGQVKGIWEFFFAIFAMHFKSKLFQNEKLKK